jgi:ZIP family zinc transporter
VGQALFWGAFSSAALFLGQFLARPLERRTRATGLLMAFGAGTLLSAVAYELVPLSSLDGGVGVAVAFALGAAAYYVGDLLIDRQGGKHRTDIDAAMPDGDVSASSGSGAAMFLGAVLDGVPEAFILGIGLALGEGISVAFVVAIFVSNVPQGTAGTLSLRAAGTSDAAISRMWLALTVASAGAAAAGYTVGDQIPDQGLEAQAFAAGAVLVMLADSMMPESFEHGGRLTGILTVAGYLLAAILTVAG